MPFLGGFPIKIGGKKAVTSAGTAEQLTSSRDHMNLHWVHLSADEDNTGKVYVGDSGVSSDSYIEVLSAGQSMDIPVTKTVDGLGLVDATTIYVDTSVDGEAVQWGYI